MKRAACLLVALSGCSLAPAAPLPSPSPSLPGDRLVYRFTDHAGEAVREGNSLATTWELLKWPAKLPSPYSGLTGDEALGVVELALTDADVADFGRPRDTTKPPPVGAVRFDPVWNRTRAVYESKTSLLAPGGSRWTFEVPAATRLRGFMALAPGSPPAEMAIELDGKERFRRKLETAGAWNAFEIPVEGDHRVSLITSGPAGAAAFWGDPQLLRSDGGAPGPNLLLVIIDTLRADALPVMPRLQALAARGARFDQAITAATWTRPSLLALLGGDLPTTLGQSAEEMIPPDAERRRFYSVAPPLLPRILERAGWQADAIGNNFFLLGYPQIGLSLGFESVADVRHPVLDTPAIERAAEAYFADHQRESWYLQVHFDGPHWPYTPPREYLERTRVPSGFPDDAMARAYLAEAAYADDYLGRLIDALARLHLDERTLVVVVGDHGEIFDHAHDHFVEALQQPTLHHHGWSAYDEILRVPLVMVRPGAIPATHVAAQVSLVDVAPTVLELLGLTTGRPMSATSGRSLAPLWRGATAEERPALTEGQDVRALRAGGWLYLQRHDGRLRVGGASTRIDEELYDLARDPAQHDNRASTALDDLRRMRRLMAQLAPTPPEAPVGVVHVRLAPDARPHVVEGVIRTTGRLSLRGLDHARAVPDDAHAVTVELRGTAQIDLSVEPPDAPVTFALTRDGATVEARQLLVGPWALPMLDDTTLDARRWSWLDAARPPVDGERGDLLLWRDPSHAAALPAPGAHADDEVAGMMRRWGYAQPGK
jgi:arylsulfatase A-like enzyme